MRFSGFVLLSAGVLMAQANRPARQPAVPWVDLGYYKQVTPERWKSRVELMLRRDAENPPKTGAVMFVGSATIAGWDLKHYFPEFDTINRGIGGSMIAETTYYTDRLITPYKPSTIVYYSGDNDTAYGVPTQKIAEDFRDFVTKIHSQLPQTRMIVLSIRPSIARAAVWDAVVAANEQLRAICAKDPKLRFLDLTPMLLTEGGKPRRELLRDDLHHLNKDGFDLISPVVARAIQADQARR